MFALLFIAAVWLGMGLTYYRRTRAAKAAGRPIVWHPRGFDVVPPELPPFPAQIYPIIGPATAATGGLDPAAFVADAGCSKKDPFFLF